ncbi:MAG: gamma-glutamyl-gamma-aminobutyrate hydrolase family protein [Dehalococcoidia bacterium]
MAFIGVTMSISRGAQGAGPERAHLNSAYLDTLQAAGGVPVLLPPQLRADQLGQLLSGVDGLLLTGGGDVDPFLYGDRTSHPAIAGVSRQRDTLEMNVIQWALAEQVPMLAICRGMQVLNVSLGGSLHQHVPEHYGEDVVHDQVAAGLARSEASHSVEVREGSLLASLVGAGRLMVNSMHHQAVRAVGTHLVISARSPDGLIEAVEAPSLGRFVLGVEWHPEEMAATNPEARALFEGLVAAARTRDANPLTVTPIRPEAAGELVAGSGILT